MGNCFQKLKEYISKPLKRNTVCLIPTSQRNLIKIAAISFHQIEIAPGRFD